jgi:hypothetical protein
MAFTFTATNSLQNGAEIMNKLSYNFFSGSRFAVNKTEWLFWRIFWQEIGNFFIGGFWQ